jgi:dihydropteroate synthase
MTASATRIVGILNLTEDSFSDGGRFLDAGRAIEHAHVMVAQGADFVELGAASSHPQAKPVSAAEEIRRLTPVMERLQAENVAVAVDSRNLVTQRYCLTRGVALLNDIEGFPDAQIYTELARSNCDLVVMHATVPGARAAPVDAGPEQVMRSIDRFFTARVKALTDAGIARDRLILDSGMGLFLSSQARTSLHVLARLAELRGRFGLRLLVSVSRKGFLGDMTGRDAGGRGAATLAAELWASTQGADYIRTHDVAALHDALRVWGGIVASR